MIRESTILVTIFLTILTVVIPRRYFLLPYILAACFIPTDQRIIVMGLDFTVLRILIAVGVLRILIYGEQSRIKLNKLDQILLAWALCSAAIYIIQWMNLKAVINRSGALFDIIGLYWLFRQKLRSYGDFRLACSLLAMSALILVPLVALEWSTGQNPFAVLGKAVTDIRAQRYRCQAAFPHSIMMGLFWATSVPLFIGLAVIEKKKLFYAMAAAAGIFLVAASASTTPILTLISIMAIMFLFKWRQHAGRAGLCLLALLTALHIVMQAPVWHLLARVNVVGASTGWHRYNLIDKAIEHFDQWAFIGCRSTEHWGSGLGDVTNQFILEGVRGGLITLLIFLAMIYLVLKALANLSVRCTGYKEQFLVWCLFSAIAGHCVAFFGVSYFGQISMLWYMMLAATALFIEYNCFLENSISPGRSKPLSASKYSLANASCSS